MTTTAGTNSGVLATVSDAEQYSLWHADDDGADWRQLETPINPTTAGDHALAVSASDDTLLLLADDGTAGRVWTGKMSGR